MDLKETECKGMEQVQFPLPDGLLVNTVMNLRLTWKLWNSLTSWATLLLKKDPVSWSQQCALWYYDDDDDDDDDNFISAQ